MSKKPQVSIHSRKHPKQNRSTQLVSSILTAATQVLAKEGVTRFTTARVAEKAGVSIGSLYQYFPNKAAILFRLQSDEWQQTTEILQNILENSQYSPFERIRNMVLSFIHSECEEAELRIALNDTAPFYRHAPEAKKNRELNTPAVQNLMKEILPESSEETRTEAGNMMMATLFCVGKHFSEKLKTSEEINKYAAAMSDMFCSYLNNIK